MLAGGKGAALGRLLLRLTRGRLSMASGFPVLLLTTTGAKSGRPRTVPLLYFELGDAVAVIGSRFGRTSHPGWYHNLRADPRATVEIGGERRACVAREATEERGEVWARAVAVYPGYDATGSEPDAASRSWCSLLRASSRAA